MKKRKQRLRTILYVIILAITILVIRQVLLLRQKIELSDIDFQEELQGIRYSCNGKSVNLNLSYEKVENERWYEIYVSNPDVDIAAFQWVDDEFGAVTHLAIVDYKLPINAWLHYSLLDPSKRYKKLYSGMILNIEDTSENETWSWVNEEVDQESIQLSNFGWWYRARYGQYYLYIEDVGKGCSSYFQEILNRLNGKFVTYLD